METTITISTLLGVVLPLIVDFVNKQVQSSKARFWISLGISALAGFLSSFLAGELTGLGLLASITLVFSASQIIYKTYWETSSIRNTLGLVKVDKSK